MWFVLCVCGTPHECVSIRCVARGLCEHQVHALELNHVQVRLHFRCIHFFTMQTTLEIIDSCLQAHAGGDLLPAPCFGLLARQDGWKAGACPAAGCCTVCRVPFSFLCAPGTTVHGCLCVKMAGKERSCCVLHSVLCAFQHFVCAWHHNSWLLARQDGGKAGARAVCCTLDKSICGCSCTHAFSNAC